LSCEIETDLLLRAQAGDGEAYEALQRRLDAPVRRFIWRLVGETDAADDIAQDAFIAFYRTLRQIQPPDKLRPYLFRIVRNRCYDELRRQGRFRQISLEADEPVEAWAVLSAPLEAEAGPEEVAHWLMLYLEVRQAMERLPELQRQTLVLYTEEELSLAEIAEVMSTSVGTVKSRLFYARKALRGLVSPATLRLLDEEFE